MNHPTKEVLVSYLYDELPAIEKSEVAAHIASCADCRAQLEQWQNVKTGLSTWKVASPTRRAGSGVALKWAAAAVVMIALGFGFGRFTVATTIDSQKIRTELQAEWKQDLQQQLKEVRAADRKEFISMLRDVEEQRIADYAQLRKDLETVAVVADEKLTTTERALNNLNLVAQNETSSRSTK